MRTVDGQGCPVIDRKPIQFINEGSDDVRDDHGNVVDYNDDNYYCNGEYVKKMIIVCCCYCYHAGDNDNDNNDADNDDAEMMMRRIEHDERDTRMMMMVVVW